MAAEAGVEDDMIEHIIDERMRLETTA